MSFGPGYEERGGWAWYTGSAARMLSAAYGLLGLEVRGSELVLPDPMAVPRGVLRLRRLVWRGQVLLDARGGAGATAATTPIGAPQTLPRDRSDL